MKRTRKRIEGKDKPVVVDEAKVFSRLVGSNGFATREKNITRYLGKLERGNQAAEGSLDISVTRWGVTNVECL